MEKIKKEKSREENDNKENKKFKKMKSVNWESNIHFEKLKIEEEIKISKENPKDFIEIEVINQDGKVIKEHVKYDHKTSKEFSKKRIENSHNEYTKAKEFFVNHENDED